MEKLRIVLNLHTNTFYLLRFLSFFLCIFSTLYFLKALHKFTAFFFFTRRFMIPGFVRACQEHLEISEKPLSISESFVLFA